MHIAEIDSISTKWPWELYACDLVCHLLGCPFCKSTNVFRLKQTLMRTFSKNRRCGLKEAQWAIPSHTTKPAYLSYDNAECGSASLVTIFASLSMEPSAEHMDFLRAAARQASNVWNLSDPVWPLTVRASLWGTSIPLKLHFAISPEPLWAHLRSRQNIPVFKHSLPVKPFGSLLFPWCLSSGPAFAMLSIWAWMYNFLKRKRQLQMITVWFIMSIVSKWMQMACPFQEPFPCGSSPFWDEKIDQGSLGRLQNFDNASIEVQVQETSPDKSSARNQAWLIAHLKMIVEIVEETLVNLGAWGSEPLERSEPWLLCSASDFRPRLTNEIVQSILFLTPWCAVQHFIFSSRSAKEKLQI